MTNYYHYRYYLIIIFTDRILNVFFSKRMILKKIQYSCFIAYTLFKSLDLNSNYTKKKIEESCYTLIRLDTSQLHFSYFFNPYNLQIFNNRLSSTIRSIFNFNGIILLTHERFRESMYLKSFKLQLHVPSL